ncbi:MAG TPA: LytTR family transcriptional regulator DNA-binding domain-containing protein [Niabella sp.]|nr:LytTR family transcriptional regulator DNA-binding domain-containing protein [Niabella sp.]HQW15112.1 LytTR family transcriptional regulator DNA-binding domain-containing protein [Niabella sp.]HQX20253.1 LytTR family transcriptional regulator DNA-binding domain-containing protein [Niabella sp.]HQX41596.1 LytTR family transcriptional regulator DNA-binding domain-containing protein [Niabella sp.]HRB07374.1 LytTR family transcriptional regulator DNA-binding domain-containing protein [Niabella s
MGFQLLEKRMLYRPLVIFVIVFNQFDIRAFRYNALDYLVKPVLATDLMEAVAKVATNNQPSDFPLGLANRLVLGEPITKITVSTQSGIRFIDLKEIVDADAICSYTVFILDDGSRYVITKTWKEVQELLEEGPFPRVHHQYIVHLNGVKHFDRVDFILTFGN